MKLLQDWGIDKSWTLFLDRDGVLNIEKHMDYIRTRHEFRFYNQVAETFSLLNQRFGRVVVVTNQRGVGRGLMREEDLVDIHRYVSEQLHLHQGHIDAFYYAPDLDHNAPHRKPNTGMALQAKADFPEIDFEKSIMVGNNLSDMEFGKRMNMKTVYVETTHPLPQKHEWIDVKFPDFLAFIHSLV